MHTGKATVTRLGVQLCHHNVNGVGDAVLYVVKQSRASGKGLNMPAAGSYRMHCACPTQQAPDCHSAQNPVGGAAIKVAHPCDDHLT